MAGTIGSKPRDAYVEKMHARIDELAADIDRLEAKARGAKADAKIEWNERLEALRARRDAAWARLEALKIGSEAAWENLRSGMEDAWAQLQAAVKEARSKM